MWKYSRCTAQTRAEQLRKLTAAFHDESDCLRFLAQVQAYINSTQITVVLLQDLEANILIEMDYVPINNYKFRVISIDENGIKHRGRPCRLIEQAAEQFSRQVRT